MFLLKLGSDENEVETDWVASSWAICLSVVKRS